MRYLASNLWEEQSHKKATDKQSANSVHAADSAAGGAGGRQYDASSGNVMPETRCQVLKGVDGANIQQISRITGLPLTRE